MCIWLYDNLDFKLEGKIIVRRLFRSKGRTGLTIAPSQGFDEFMNVVLDDAEEVWVKVSKKADGEASSNGRVKREYGDRKTLGAFHRPKLYGHILMSFTGRLLLKGENITLIAPAQASSSRSSGAVNTQMEQ